MNKLNVLWTTTNKDTINTMIAMYTINALKYGWFQKVNVLIWGGATKLVKEDKSIQETIKEMIDSGVSVEACKACAKIHKAVDVLISLGVNVRYTGEALTSYLKGEDKFISL